MTTKRHWQDHAQVLTALRRTILEASPAELEEALDGEFTNYAAQGKAVAARALADTDKAEIQVLHRSLGVLAQLLRRRSKLSISELATRARIDPSELAAIEIDPSFEANPRTIFQLERYFRLPERSLIGLSGAIKVDDDIQQEAVRFAAHSENIVGLSKEELRLLNRFIKFLRDRTDR